MLQIARLHAQRLIPKIPAYINSPMAINATEICRAHHGEPDAADILRGRVKRELGWLCRVPEQLEQVQLFAQASN